MTPLPGTPRRRRGSPARASRAPRSAASSIAVFARIVAIATSDGGAVAPSAADPRRPASGETRRALPRSAAAAATARRRISSSDGGSGDRARRAQERCSRWFSVSSRRSARCVTWRRARNDSEREDADRGQDRDDAPQGVPPRERRPDPASHHPAEGRERDDRAEEEGDERRSIERLREERVAVWASGHGGRLAL